MSCTFIALDFEIANRGWSSACAIALVRVVDGRIVAQEKRLIDPQTYFLGEFVDLHGITAELVRGAPLFAQVWKELLPLLDGVEFIAAHNAAFDRGVLRKCCQKHGIEVPKQEFKCTIRLAKEIWKLDSYVLSNVCKHLEIELNHHEPLSDATACAQIVIKALNNGYRFHSYAV